MATNTRLVTFNAQNVTPQDDGLLYEKALPQTGIIYGADMTQDGPNTIHIDTGFGIVRGRFFEISASDITVPLSSSGEIQGRIIGRLDLSNTDDPFVILAQTGTLTPLRVDDDVNIFNGVHEFLLATFMANEITVSSFVDVKPMIKGNMYEAYEIVNSLPAAGETGKVYMMPDGDGLNAWIYMGGQWRAVSDAKAIKEVTLAGYTDKGMGLADGSDIDPIRTTKYGLLPYDNAGTSYVGTTALPFKQVCAGKMLEWSALHNAYVSCSSGGKWLSSGALAGHRTFVVPEKAKEVVVMVETPDQKAYNIRLVATTNDLIMSGYYLDANNAGAVAVTYGANRTVGLDYSYTKVVSGGTVYRRADMTFTVYYK